MLMLAWLTVSAPVVNACTRQNAKQERKMNNSSPLAGSEEEKVPSSSGAINEYLHEDEEMEHPNIAVTKCYTVQQPSLYIAFHGELVSPPPEA